MTMPRLLVTVVFPAPGLGLVSTITCGARAPRLGRRMEVSVARKASAIITNSDLSVAPVLRHALQSSFSPFSLPVKPKTFPWNLFRAENNPRTWEELSAKGIAPSSGRFKYAGATPGAAMRRSKRSRRMLRAVPRNVPISSPRAEFRG
jgi:hypothetical protein